MKQFIPVLKQTKLFAGLMEQEIEAMLSCLGARRKEYKKGETVFLTWKLPHRKNAFQNMEMILRFSRPTENKKETIPESIAAQWVPGCFYIIF